MRGEDGPEREAAAVARVAAFEHFGFGLDLSFSDPSASHSAPPASRPRRLPGMRPRRVQAGGQVSVASLGGLIEAAHRFPRGERRRRGGAEEEQETKGSPSL